MATRRVWVGRGVTINTGSGVDHYTYTFTVSGNSTIAVVIGGDGGETTYTAYKKVNGSWTAWKQVSKAYRKVSGAWTEVNVSEAFGEGVKYIFSS